MCFSPLTPLVATPLSLLSSLWQTNPLQAPAAAPLPGPRVMGTKGMFVSWMKSFLCFGPNMLSLRCLKKNKEFETEIKTVVGSFVKTEVDRLEKKVDTGFADIEKN